MEQESLYKNVLRGVHSNNGWSSNMAGRVFSSRPWRRMIIVLPKFRQSVLIELEMGTEWGFGWIKGMEIDTLERDFPEYYAVQQEEGLVADFGAPALQNANLNLHPGHSWVEDFILGQ